ncbi:hypothetical protein AX774_g8056 [Zancudomyces culisetae]|uniref:Uncharacterized protein n=1 Tax=Zancudomyces culisetae TaxID=1213189 RepID=A0A1R1PC66_ZANCU|nr:hypothetical protein AX774_g8056 [Zancudomyces culisetae]|eukprot:OMH78550.1 hypothetical protein AX774_g8056 [Zancudomyces culisetae]
MVLPLTGMDSFGNPTRALTTCQAWGSLFCGLGYTPLVWCIYRHAFRASTDLDLSDAFRQFPKGSRTECPDILVHATAPSTVGGG